MDMLCSSKTFATFPSLFSVSDRVNPSNFPQTRGDKISHLVTVPYINLAHKYLERVGFGLVEGPFPALPL
jgi:hypothetical protein